MKFGSVKLLNLFWLLIPLLGIFLICYRQKYAALLRFADKSLISKLNIQFSRFRWWLKTMLILCVFIFSIFALSRPQWGFEWQEVKREGIDILLVVDTSKSMLAQDVKPNRLARTKLAVQDLLKDLKGDRVGLIAFSGDAFMLCPLTIDYDGFLLSLNDLSINSVPRGGTNLEKALNVALSSYQDVANKHKAVIVITDGDDLEGNPIKVAQKAHEEGVKIYTIGIGTKSGELIQIRNEKGQNEFLKDQNGNFIKSRLNESLLQQIALTTEAFYIKSSGAQFGLETIYQRALSKVEKREFESSREKKYFERFQIPLAISILLLVIDSCVTTRKKF